MRTDKVINRLDKLYPELPIFKFKTNPFRTLIITVISQRVRDEQTIKVAKFLFSRADSPKSMLDLSVKQLEKLLRPSGIYRQKTKRIREICRILIKKYHGKVPRNEKDLLDLPGVGRKTANIVLAHSFGIDTIAVDTHVHRISNRLGWVKTNSPEKTEAELKKIVSLNYWSTVNRIFVRHGQEICKPISPKCSLCVIKQFCRRVGVNSSR